MRVRRWWLVVGASLMLLVVPGYRAGADEFIQRPVTVNTGSKADNWQHTYCWGPGMAANPQLQTAANYGMANLDGQSTPYYDTFLASCTTTTDVVWEVGPFASEFYADYTCLNYNEYPYEECERARIRYNSAANGPFTDARNRQAACHELGHSLGLTHAGDDCMDENDGVHQNYSEHHVRHVEASHDSPIGNFEFAANVPGVGVRVKGWALDPDVRSVWGEYQPQIHVYVDTYYGFNLGSGTVVRTDVGAEYPFWWVHHGFDHTIGVGPGSHLVCVYAVNVNLPGSGGANTLLGCTTVWLT